MRIVHLCRAFSPLSETFIYDYVTELDQQGFDCHVVTPERLNEVDRPFNKVTPVPLPPKWNPRRFVPRALAEFGIGDVHSCRWHLLRPHLKTALLSLAPDVVHAHFGHEGVLIAPITDALQIPLVVSFHGYDAFHLPQMKLWKRELGDLFRQAAVVTVVSHFMQKHLVQLGSPPDRTHLIHVGKRLSEYPFRPSPPERIKRWISVGRLTEKKGHLDCLAAFRNIVKKHPDQSLTIIGEGTLRTQIEAYLNRHDLHDKVKLLGALPHDEVKRIMAASDAFILCSKTSAKGDKEGIPTVLMEAQALGLPCVTTWHSGIPEVIPEENHGLLANEGDVIDLTQCINKLISCSPLELTQIIRRGRAKIEKAFDLERETQRIQQLYHECIPTHPTAIV